MSSRIASRVVLVAACATALVGAGAGAAYGGEITGQKRTLEVVEVPGGDPVVHGGSECAYSGLNDEFILGDTAAPRVQTPARVGRFVGVACRGFASSK